MRINYNSSDRNISSL